MQKLYYLLVVLCIVALHSCNNSSSEAAQTDSTRSAVSGSPKMATDSTAAFRDSATGGDPTAAKDNGKGRIRNPQGALDSLKQIKSSASKQDIE